MKFNRLTIEFFKKDLDTLPFDVLAVVKQEKFYRFNNLRI